MSHIWCNYHQKMMTHHSVMTSSLCFKILKIDKFGDFSSDIDSNAKMDIFRDVISLIINQCDPRLPKGASGGQKVSASRAAQASEAHLYIYTIRTKIFDHHENLDTNSIKLDLFKMEQVPKQYNLVQIRNLHILITHN